MKKMKILSVLILLATVLVACQKEEDTVMPVNGRTVLVYIAANNSLGSSNFDDKDLEEMMAGMKQVDVEKNNLIVYLAGYRNNPELIRIGKNGKGEVVRESIVKYGAQNSVSVDVMKNVFSAVFSKYPADSYGIVFWSHGDGWIPYSNSSGARWWGQDTGNGDMRMNIPELDEALSTAPHFDFIFFDACFMQSIEVVYQLRHHADYFIGSPTEIPGPGAPYDVVVPKLFSFDNPAISIAESYFNVYFDKYANGNAISNTNWTGGVSLSVVKSSELENLATATKGIVQAREGGEAGLTSGILCYDPLREKNYHDLMGYMQKLQEDAVAFEHYKAAFQKAVIWKNTTENNYCTYASGMGKMVSMHGFEGVSTYILRGEKTQNQYYRQYMQWCSAAGWN